MTMSPQQKHRQHLVWAGVLFCVALTSVTIAQRTQGIARDEVVYMHHGSRYVSWWSQLIRGGQDARTETGITRHFGGSRATDNNREHPPLMKVLFGISHAIFYKALGWCSPLTAYRLPSAAMFGLLVVLVFWFVRSVWGFYPGLLASLFTLLLPRVFFHAQLAAFDVPVATMWMASLCSYYVALGSRKWCIGFGVVFGLTLATKHNALMLPMVLGLHYVWVGFRRTRSLRGVLSAQPLLIPSILVLSPCVLFAVWPWLWLDPVAHVIDWIQFHLHHVHYNYEYLGRNWNAPPYPWHVPFVTTALTIPVTTLVAAAVGIVGMFRQNRTEHIELDRAPGVLLLLSFAVAIVPFALRITPIFAATKHWIPALIPIAMCAGIGVARTASVLARLRPSGHNRTKQGKLGVVLASALGVLVVGAAAMETVRAQPFALSHYNSIAGGVSGGATMGMNRQYWGYAARAILPYVNQYAPSSPASAIPVYTHDASPAWSWYRKLGLLRGGLPDAGREQVGIQRSKIAIVIHERHFNRHDYLIWQSYGTVQPSYVLTKERVPLVSVYVHPSLKKIE